MAEGARAIAIALACLAGTALGADAPAPPPASVYTPLDGPQCLLAAAPQAGTEESRATCPGIAGYRLERIDADARMSVNVIAPGGSVYPLRYWDVISRHFSSLGAQAEWRVLGTPEHPRPIALIVRVKASEDPDSERTTQYLAVARIDAAGACVVARIAPGGQANVRARAAADAAAAAPCLPPLP